MNNQLKKVIIVGCGFAGLGCARKLLSHKNVHLTLIDKNNFQQFQPLLYQVATSELAATNIAFPIREIFENKTNVDIKMAEVTSIDPTTKTVFTKQGETYQGDYLVLAAGSQVNFFDTPGAFQNSFPLYSLNDAERLRSHLLTIFEDTDRNPNLLKEGALNFVIIGAGPTGTEMAGALADMINEILPKEYIDLSAKTTCIYLVDYNHVVLGAFSESSQVYAAQKLQKRGVQLRLGVAVKEVYSDHVLLSDGIKILTHTVIWAGGLKAAKLSAHCGLTEGKGSRIDVQPDLTVRGFSSIYALGDFANIPNSKGKNFPQLASVAQQSGYWTAKNIAAEMEGKPLEPFQYNDKGIMAMIGRNAAVAEIGEKRHELHGAIAFSAWLGVHIALIPTIRQKLETFIEWAWDYFGKTREVQVLDRAESTKIDWMKNK